MLAKHSAFEKMGLILLGTELCWMNSKFKTQTAEFCSRNVWGCSTLVALPAPLSCLNLSWIQLKSDLATCGSRQGSGMVALQKAGSLWSLVALWGSASPSCKGLQDNVHQNSRQEQGGFIMIYHWCKFPPLPSPSAILVQIKGPRLPSQPTGSGLPKENKPSVGRLPTKHFQSVLWGWEKTKQPPEGQGWSGLFLIIKLKQGLISPGFWLPVSSQRKLDISENLKLGLYLAAFWAEAAVFHRVQLNPGRWSTSHSSNFHLSW